MTAAVNHDEPHVEDTSAYGGVIYYLHTGDFVPRYIGQTTQPLARRFRQHQADARRGRTYPVYDWMRKHGIENIQVCTLELLTEDQLEWLDSREEFYIAMYRCPTANPIMNLDGGGKSHRGVSEETRAKMSASAKVKVFTLEHRKNISLVTTGENNPNFGKTHTPEARKRIGDARRGKPLSAEHKAKLSGENHQGFGKELPPETREKISAAKLGKPNQGAAKYNHTRWHVNRNIIKPECKFCEEVTVNG